MTGAYIEGNDETFRKAVETTACTLVNTQSNFYNSTLYCFEE